MTRYVRINEFAKIIHDILKTDRDVNIAVGGMTGVGKSTFMAQLQKKYSEIADVYWGFDRMTWSRKELMKWIDGEGENKEGQLPEYSALLVDELFLLFYSRNWYERDQIDAISVFNMCRDRHLFIGGNVPNFWELDGAFRERMRFYIFIPRRGIAWVFEQEINPFVRDSWNVKENMHVFRRNKNPYKCKNFLMEISFPDFSPEEKEEYLKIRNLKRVESLELRKEERQGLGNVGQKEKWISQLIKLAYDNIKFKNWVEFSKVVDMSDHTVKKYFNMWTHFGMPDEYESFLQSRNNESNFTSEDD